jgi:CTP-dependent riboflavin kinase
MQKQWVLKGKVVSGVRKAAYFTQLDWVQEQCLERLGFRPYPGTLNVEISEESLPILEVLQREQGIELIPPDTKFCAARAMLLSVGNVSGALIIPAEDVRVHGKNIVEVISPLRLKDALQVKDGDPLTLIVKRLTS